jgi:Tfp pilus assembly protein PilV
MHLKTKQIIRDQRGVAMALELVLVGVVLVVAGVVGVRAYQQHQLAASNSKITETRTSTSPKASVDATVKEVNNDAVGDVSASADHEKDIDEVTATSNEAVNLEGSVNEKDL